MGQDENPPIEMLQLLLVSPFVDTVCSFVQVHTLLMYSVPCPRSTMRGVYACMKRALPLTLPSPPPAAPSLTLWPSLLCFRSQARGGSFPGGAGQRKARRSFGRASIAPPLFSSRSNIQIPKNQTGSQAAQGVA